jgi:DNA repair protein RadC
VKYDIISTRKLRNIIQIKQPVDLIGFLKRYTKSKQEQFILITLNGVHEVIGIHIVTIGLVNQTIIHPREVFNRAIKDNASAIITAHNHPSGNCKPSAEDEVITGRLKEAAIILGFSFLDHLIIAKDGYYSFRQDGNVLA